MSRRNFYIHEIDLEKLSIKNASKKLFAEKIEKIRYRGYEVESISDGRKIVITKPGGKHTRGQVKKEDFMVFIFNPNENSLWLISHKNIYDDLVQKSKKNPEATFEIINSMEEVFNGEEPEEIIKKYSLLNTIGEIPEVLLKAYKWIWGQEDVNYPKGEGRSKSFKKILELKEKLSKI